MILYDIIWRVSNNLSVEHMFSQCWVTLSVQNCVWSLVWNTTITIQSTAASVSPSNSKTSPSLKSEIDLEWLYVYIGCPNSTCAITSNLPMLMNNLNSALRSKSSIFCRIGPISSPTLVTTCNWLLDYINCEKLFLKKSGPVSDLIAESSCILSSFKVSRFLIKVQ